MARPWTRRRDWSFVAGFGVLFIVFVWLAIATWIDPGGHWWVTASFTACAVVSGGNGVVWWRNHLKGSQR